eukprot:3350072-Prymnesium_polylepis.1
MAHGHTHTSGPPLAHPDIPCYHHINCARARASTGKATRPPSRDGEPGGMSFGSSQVGCCRPSLRPGSELFPWHTETNHTSSPP